MLSVKNSAIITVTVVAAILVMAPALMSTNIHMVAATGHHGHHGHHDHDDHHNHHNHHSHHKSNHVNQEIEQKQRSHQDSQCVSGGNTNGSCNNLSFQNQHNKGNNAAAEE